ncbi:uncharacterized [Tachysurus ichikawai]
MVFMDTTTSSGCGQSSCVNSFCIVGQVWSEFLQKYLSGVRVGVDERGLEFQCRILLNLKETSRMRTLSIRILTEHYCRISASSHFSAVLLSNSHVEDVKVRDEEVYQVMKSVSVYQVMKSVSVYKVMKSVSVSVYKVMKSVSVYQVMKSVSVYKVMKSVSVYKVMKSVSVYQVMKSVSVYKVMKSVSVYKVMMCYVMYDGFTNAPT